MASYGISITASRIWALLTTTALLASLAAVSVAGPVLAAEARCDGKVATIVSWKKVIYGTAGDDVIVAKGGKSNKIYGRGGSDRICAGKGADLVVGGSGNDRIFGGRGNDTLRGGTGSDFLFGSRGHDLLLGQRGNDSIDGAHGIDGCRQGKGSGPVRRCEVANLTVEISAPSVATEGMIDVDVQVWNRGPNAAAYQVMLDDTEVVDVGCEWPTEAIWTKHDPLAPGASRTHR